MHRVTLSNGRTFVADPAISILDAARAGGIVLEYSCRTGRCGVCKTNVQRGETKILNPETEGLAESELAAGTVLTCCRAAAGDIWLDLEPLDRLAGLAIRTIPSRIVSVDLVASDIVKVVLRVPPASSMHFVAGQYIDVIASDVRRSYSIANAPRADGLIELIIKRYPGGTLSNYWFERAKVNDLLRIEGPFGTFFSARGCTAPHLFSRDRDWDCAGQGAP